MAVLIGMSGNFKGQKFELDREEVFIGRNSQNDIWIEDSSVSGRHCSVTRDERRYTLTDLGSTNGTRLNGAPVTKARLKPKDIVQVGNVEVMFDGADVDIEGANANQTTRVEVMSEPIAVSETFHTASPFGSRRDSRKPWLIVTALVGLLVLIGIVYFVMFVLL